MNTHKTCKMLYKDISYFVREWGITLVSYLNIQYDARDPGSKAKTVHSHELDYTLYLQTRHTVVDEFQPCIHLFSLHYKALIHKIVLRMSR